MTNTTEQMIEQKAEALLNNSELFNKVLDYVEQGKQKVLARFLGPDFNHIIQTAYNSTANYNQEF